MQRVREASEGDRHRSPSYPLRLPGDIRDALERLAQDHTRSLNQEIVYALRQYVSQERTQ